MTLDYKVGSNSYWATAHISYRIISADRDGYACRAGSGADLEHDRCFAQRRVVGNADVDLQESSDESGRRTGVKELCSQSTDRHRGGPRAVQVHYEFAIDPRRVRDSFTARIKDHDIAAMGWLVRRNYLE